MSDLLLLGIDTGGTYTDAVIMTDEEPPKVRRSAKALTTHEDLAAGIANAMASVVGPDDADRVGLVALSTTLATNAIVEGHGGRVCLVTMGIEPSDLVRAGIDSALADGQIVTIAGGHTSHGDELAPLDLEELDRELVGVDPRQLTGFAVVGQFAVRNPDHEERVRRHLRQRFGIGVTCSHELTAELNGPKRAVTSVLNARLLGLINELISAAQSSMATLGVVAPLMLVRGDGTLVAAALAAERPIETILSGPAASVTGAHHLVRHDLVRHHHDGSDLDRAIVADIGGTTTDIAVLDNGRARLRPQGATVGGHDTMVEAVEIQTIGLGGDSEVTIDDSGNVTRLRLGPRRLVPISMLAALHPDAIRPALADQVRSQSALHLAGCFATLRQAGPEAASRSEHERHVLDGLADGPVALRDLLPTKRHEIALDRLVRAGVVSRSGFTPTDAAHVLGLHDGFDTNAAEQAAELLARSHDRRGTAIADSPSELARRTVAELHRRTVDAVLAVALHTDGFDPFDSLQDERSLLTAGLDRHRGLVEVDVRLGVPLIGLGASAPVYHPAVAERLGTEIMLSSHAAVANAIGAAVGRIRVSRRSTITRKKNGTFMAAGRGHDSLDAAVTALTDELTEEVGELARRAGAGQVELEVERKDNVVTVGDDQFFVEAAVTVIGSGRPIREIPSLG